MILEELAALVRIDLQGERNLDRFQKGLDGAKKSTVGLAQTFKTRLGALTVPLRDTTKGVDKLGDTSKKTARAGSGLVTVLKTAGLVAARLVGAFAGTAGAAATMGAGFAVAGGQIAKARRELALLTKAAGTTPANLETLQNVFSGLGFDRARATKALETFGSLLDKARAGDTDAQKSLAKAGLKGRDRDEFGRPRDRAALAFEALLHYEREVKAAAAAEEKADAGAAKAAEAREKRQKNALALQRQALNLREQADKKRKHANEHAEAFGVTDADERERINRAIAEKGLVRIIDEQSRLQPPLNRDEQARRERVGRQFEEAERKAEALGAALGRAADTLQVRVAEQILPAITRSLEGWIRIFKRAGLIEETKEERAERESNQREGGRHQFTRNRPASRLRETENEIGEVKRQAEKLRETGDNTKADFLENRIPTLELERQRREDEAGLVPQPEQAPPQSIRAPVPPRRPENFTAPRRPETAPVMPTPEQRTALERVLALVDEIASLQDRMRRAPSAFSDIDTSKLRGLKDELHSLTDALPEGVRAGMGAFLKALDAGGVEAIRKAEEIAQQLRRALEIEVTPRVNTSSLNAAHAKAELLAAAVRKFGEASAATPASRRREEATPASARARRPDPPATRAAPPPLRADTASRAAQPDARHADPAQTRAQRPEPPRTQAASSRPAERVGWMRNVADVRQQFPEVQIHRIASDSADRASRRQPASVTQHFDVDVAVTAPRGASGDRFGQTVGDETARRISRMVRSVSIAGDSPAKA